MKLPSVAERTCLSTFDVPDLNIATVASAIGLPPSSRTMPLITPRFPPCSAGGGGVGVSASAVDDAIVKITASSPTKLIERVKPISANVSKFSHRQNSSESGDKVL